MRARRLTLAGCLALVAVVAYPYLVAWRWPPAGTGFTGTFFYLDDFFQYLSFVEQAARGEWAFRNKFDLRPHDGIFVNLEWAASGALAALLGGRPVLGFHALRLLAAAAMLAAFARILGAFGLAGGRLAWGLALVAGGGGLGWLRYWQGQLGSRIPDLRWSVFPFQEALTNPHFVFGTACLLWAAIFHAEWRAGSRGRGAWIATAWLLGLSRPFDLATLLAIAGAAAAADCARPATRRAGLARAAELIWLTPVLVYQALVLRLHPGFSTWSGGQNVIPPAPLLEFVWALGPAAVLALAFGRADLPGVAGELRWLLASWAGVVLAALLLSRLPFVPSFALQLLPGVGGPLLLLAAAGLPAAALPWAVAGLAPTSLFLFWSVLHSAPVGFAPRGQLAATDVLARACRPGDVVLAPPDLGLLVAGRTPCSVVLGHRVLTPGMEQRRAEAGRFYDPGTPAWWRQAYLDSTGARFVALPQGGRVLLGETAPLALRIATPEVEIWERARAASPGAGPAPPD